MNPHWLPATVPWRQNDGETWEKYEQRLFHVFQQEFSSEFSYGEKPVRYKRFPYTKIYPEAFIHLITCNQDDSGERLPDLQRSKRIGWPRPAIEHHTFCEVCGYTECTRPWVWKGNGKDKSKVKIYLPNQQYLVVLGERKDYWVLVTAYYVSRSHTLNKLKNEYHSRFSTVLQ